MEVIIFKILTIIIIIIIIGIVIVLLILIKKPYPERSIFGGF